MRYVPPFPLPLDLPMNRLVELKCLCRFFFSPRYMLVLPMTFLTSGMYRFQNAHHRSPEQHRRFDGVRFSARYLQDGTGRSAAKLEARGRRKRLDVSPVGSLSHVRKKGGIRGQGRWQRDGERRAGHVWLICVGIVCHGMIWIFDKLEFWIFLRTILSRQTRKCVTWGFSY